ncbi:DUF4199 domain-containing protein [Hymenobacter psychrophilus]|uniref:DUF4199 domain-containing protein n=1 Tax=Hymenobacter psychrophilus TaxID=651662 RepID=A0A1H3L7G3_9BACT|nr:DUF4199 domain-containing protein [Hymenobacter psychrophilus]SDY59888.1 Protein of unknown function [Hymenobacter psychrophilus]
MKNATMLTENTRVSARRLAVRYGVLAFGLMLLYFFAITALGLQRYNAARFGSHAFTVLATFLAIRAYKVQMPATAPYLPGLGVGFLVGLVGSTLYAAAIFLYANVFSSAYAIELRQQTYFGEALGSALLAGSIIVLGVVLGSLTGYTLMMSNGPYPRPTDGKSSNA